MSSPRIAILTFVVGADYKRNLAACLESKRAYAKRHGYTYIEAGEEFWDRDRPIAWSKIPFWLDTIKKRGSEFDYFWISDADVLITNPTIRLEPLLTELLPAGKDLMMNLDACKNLNSGNMFARPSAWFASYLEQVWNKTDDLYHIWWENKAMIDVMLASEVHKAHIHVNAKHWLLNAYLGGRKGERLWIPGDLLVHFAGVYDTEKMKALCQDILSGKVPRITFFPPEEDAATQETKAAQAKTA
jgi:hypothetical protein